MASKAAKAAAKAARGVISLDQKQTVQSTGFYEVIRKTFTLDADRSNGVPLNPYFRNPPPGSLDPLGYTDPVTIPAGDIADNPYWKRDVRRSHPKLSVVSQGDVVGLLTVGSAAKPRVELIGDEGKKELVRVEEEAEAGGLSVFFEGQGEKSKELVSGEGGLFVGGLPPTPAGQRLVKKDGEEEGWAVHPYSLESEQSYGDDYPCRSFR